MKTKTLFTLLILVSIFNVSANKYDNIPLESISETRIIKNNDIYLMNAALVAPNGKAYFFTGQYYHKYNIGTSKSEIKTKITNKNWKGLPTNVDAALVHPLNKKGYIFKGNNYYRVVFGSRYTVDKVGVIGVDGWKGLEGPFDAVITHPTNNSAYFFKGKKYYRFSFSKNKVDKIGTIGVDGWKGLPYNANAALIHNNGKAYFFKDDMYYRYDFNKDRVDKIGTIGVNGWKNLFFKLDAANTHDKASYGEYFNHSYCYYWEWKKGDDPWFPIALIESAPATREIKKKKIGYERYFGVPSDVDAVLLHPINKKVYLLKGSKYYRYNTSLHKVEKVGIIGKDGWKGVPQKIDAAVTHPNGKTYFFKGTKYYRFNHSTNKVDKIANIKDNWKGVPNNIDAVTLNPSGGIFFHKKSIVYKYDSAKRRVISTAFISNSIDKTRK